MPARREKAAKKCSDVITDVRSEVINSAKLAMAAASCQEGRGSSLEKPEERQQPANVETGDEESFPQGVSPGPLVRESFNNRYHCGFAQ